MLAASPAKASKSPKAKKAKAKAKASKSPKTKRGANHDTGENSQDKSSVKRAYSAYIHFSLDNRSKVRICTWSR